MNMWDCHCRAFAQGDVSASRVSGAVSVAVRGGGGIAQADIAGATIAAFGAAFAEMVVTGVLGAVHTDFPGASTANRTNKNKDFHD
jgi:hypothetical protein